ncbi:hypothetical protein BDY17DRAFT_64593 [Neohortaea acidophila]|uniref:Uncharacterized protein n=1 Tax=Neohortaea acidophila TaxID=245834 RepID=A0A6A6PEY8_9PEZI|nr:uncharacterized protein BDY17DRAFT_64593 [Neohortaea acidophila]KAF2478502.1 hypothetical protein BDY17DRAFT_64593 [Neohortaea acidophila]
MLDANSTAFGQKFLAEASRQACSTASRPFQCESARTSRPSSLHCFLRIRQQHAIPPCTKELVAAITHPQVSHALHNTSHAPASGCRYEVPPRKLPPGTTRSHVTVQTTSCAKTESNCASQNGGEPPELELPQQDDDNDTSSENWSSDEDEPALIARTMPFMLS